MVKKLKTLPKRQRRRTHICSPLITRTTKNLMLKALDLPLSVSIDVAARVATIVLEVIAGGRLVKSSTNSSKATKQNRSCSTLTNHNQTILTYL